MYKYLIKDDENNLIIGYCKDIIGLLDLSEDSEHNFYDITLIDVELTKIFIEHCTTTKSRVSGIYLCMLGQDGKILGSYFFASDKPISFHKNLIMKDNFNLSLSGGFSSIPSFEAMEIWRQWMVSKPEKINDWARLSKKQRLGWLEVVRIHSGFVINNASENTEYYLDMTYVEDSISFYCALGEAMNGPGGYYGFNLYSVEDCFCGGFGAVPPFFLHFRNGNLDELILQGTFEKADKEKLQQLKDLFISNQVTLLFN
ncbi:MAG: barnase inhibitor [Paenibacillus sp.]|jgi:hypothetical protein|nr:barnase inhibitor [Paenibacillus sp.]